MSKIDPLFQRFECWNGPVEDGFARDFLGCKTRTKYWTGGNYEEFWSRFAPSHYGYPPFDYEYFEWLTLLQSIVSAQGKYTMIELGAGWGRWICRAARAISAYKHSTDYLLVAVEADSAHYQWIKEHLADNEIDMARCRLYEAAVSKRGGWCKFTTAAKPSDFYGQRSVSITTGGAKLVKAITLRSTLSRLDKVDLIDMDIEGAEYDVILGTIKELNHQCKRLYIEVHRPQYDGLLKQLLTDNGWIPTFGYCKDQKIVTDYGEYVMPETAQGWVNGNSWNKA